MLGAVVAGGALGCGAAAGSALLLYTSQGLLATAGFLLAVLLVAVAAGTWAGTVEDVSAVQLAHLTRWRWLWAVLAYAAAGVLSAFWNTRASLRDAALGGALAVLLILAEPAYAAGSLIAGLNATRRGRAATIAVAAIGGAALGILLATAMLIPRFDAPFLFLGAAVALAMAGVIETASGGTAMTAKELIMNGKVVLVTGVSEPGQLGFAIARQLLQHGARVAITSRSPRVSALADELRQYGDVLPFAADLTSPDDATRFVSAAFERFGRIDAVINTAGGLSVIKSVMETTPEEWRSELQRNAETALILAKAVLPALRQSRGSIVNFASPAVLRPSGSLAAYTAAKAALVALTRTLALEEKTRGVRVNAIAPGTIDTEQNRRNTADPAAAHFVTREQVASVAEFLISDAASAITGEVIQVLGEQIR
jgi:NAD(P)-dependent dehydrogenase (short-subunit alcohol dehydrogenase family)